MFCLVSPHVVCNSLRSERLIASCAARPCISGTRRQRLHPSLPLPPPAHPRRSMTPHTCRLSATRQGEVLVLGKAQKDYIVYLELSPLFHPNPLMSPPTCPSIPYPPAERITALRAWYKHCLPGRWKSTVLRPGIIGMHGPTIIRLRPCMISSAPPPPGLSPLVR